MPSPDHEAGDVEGKVEFHGGELFPRLGCVATNLEPDNRAVVPFYDKRRTAAQWTNQGNQTVKMTRLSCHIRSDEPPAAFTPRATGKMFNWSRSPKRTT